ncbi:MAG: protein TolR [Desulfobacterales bacterium]|nr:protein TolR [Desulfobacterales bacterium]
MQGASNNNSQLMSEINVTPLVDVMLVLLIIFMVTAPMMIQGENVALPTTESSPLDADENQIVITINEKKEVFINEVPVQLNLLKEKLKNILENRREQQVLIRADRSLLYETVIEVMSEVKGAGAQKLGLVTEPKSKS